MNKKHVFLCCKVCSTVDVSAISVTIFFWFTIQSVIPCSWRFFHKMIVKQDETKKGKTRTFFFYWIRSETWWLTLYFLKNRHHDLNNCMTQEANINKTDIKSIQIDINKKHISTISPPQPKNIIQSTKDFTDKQI